MSNIIFYRYRIYCEVDNRYEYIWLESTEDPPIYCPVDQNHTINLQSVEIIETLKTDKINISEEKISTGGRFRVDSHSMVCDPSTTTENIIIYPYPINALNFTIDFNDENSGDILNTVIGPKTTATTISNDVVIGDQIITVDDGSQLKIGYKLFLDDNINCDDMGMIISINGNIVTLENQAVNNFLSTTPTVVRIESHFVKNLKLPSANVIDVFYSGLTKVGTLTYLEKNRAIKVIYENKDAISKQFTFRMEYLY